ncbi:putative ABC exporter domain-containing protein [uncultured Desulfobulbus sp.]|uniref:putative ABC exporter domain-containing protein n=1 Tax=uncultured Desulfobulbus sp. TaxID=239745 RepID=UPI0029C8AD05|nr:putative ABC exporter domain-containing protein [uncultured Desulfobulbus sp.]
MITLLYLDLWQLINLIKITLRSPKRLIPIVAVLLWMALILLPQRLAGNPQLPPQMNIAGFIMPQNLWAIIFFLLSALTILNIYKAFSESVLVFTMPEIDMIFPTPISRRQVMSLKLLKVYAKYAVMTLFFTIMIFPSLRLFGFMQAGMQPASIFISIMLFVILTTNISITINLISSYQKESRIQPIAIVRTAIYILIGIVLIGVGIRYTSTHDIVQSVVGILTHPLFTTILTPIKWVADLLVVPFQLWFTTYLVEFILLTLLTIASYLLVLSRDENPYEPSLMVSARFAAMRTAFKAGNMYAARTALMKERMKNKRVSYGLPPFGGGALAILWKNLNITFRSSFKGWIVSGIILAALMMIARNSGIIGKNDITPFAMIGIAYLLFLGSLMMSHSLRNDMKQVNILKPMPVSPWKLIAVEPIHGVLVISIMCAVVIGMIYFIIGLKPGSPLFATLYCLPFAAYSCLSAQVAAVVLYPNWDDLTQRYLSQMASMAASIFGLLLPIIVFVVFLQMKLPTTLTVGIVGAICLVLSVVGIALGTWAYRTHDPSDE